MSIRATAPTDAPVSSKLHKVLRAGIARDEAPTALATKTEEVPGHLLISFREALDVGTTPQWYRDLAKKAGGVLSIPLSVAAAFKGGPTFTDDDLLLLHLKNTNQGTDKRWALAESKLALGYTFHVYQEQYREWAPRHANNHSLTTCRLDVKTRYRIYATENTTRDQGKEAMAVDW